jgi:hypothetical protein
LATNRDVMARTPFAGVVPLTNASNASIATRHRSPTRRAGNRPNLIQRWTDRVLAPIRAAAWLGLNSRVIE